MANYTKLRTGDWGVRVEGEPKPGDAIVVTKKSGESKTETIGRVVWSGGGVSLCTIGSSTSSTSSTPSTPSRRRSRGARYCEGWGADNPHAPRAPYTCDECGDE